MLNQQSVQQFHFFPHQFRRYSNFLQFNSQQRHPQLLVSARPKIINKQNKQLEIRFKNDSFFKLELTQQFLLIKNIEKDQIIQIIEANFDINFQIIQQKISYLDHNENDMSQILNFITKKTLIFSFRGLNHLKVQLQINSEQKQSLSRFIQVLGKMFIHNQNFHKRFKPIQKISCGQNYAIIKSKDLVKCQQLIVRACRKQIFKIDLWKDLQLLGRIQRSKSAHLLQVIGFYETSNSVYIIFQKFDFFIQNYSRRFNQKFDLSFTSQYQKKIINALKIISKIIQNLKQLHLAGLSMSGMFGEPNLVFQQNNGIIIPKLNPFLDNILKNNQFNHQNNLKQRIFCFYNRQNSQIIPPEIIQQANWKYLDEINYFNFMKKSEVFGLGNLLHTLIFNQSVFGKKDPVQINRNNKNGRLVLSTQIQEIKLQFPQVIEMILQMIEIDHNSRISLIDLENRVNQLLKNLNNRPKTSHQIFIQGQGQKQFFKQNKKIKNQLIQNNSQAENKIVKKSQIQKQYQLNPKESFKKQKQKEK